jgi:hypothetical protein
VGVHEADHLSEMLRTPARLAILVAGILLILAGLALGELQRAHRSTDSDRALRTVARSEAASLDAYFGRARAMLRVVAENPAFLQFTTQPSHAVTDRVNAALISLEKLYPDSIGEACFIAPSGIELARATKGRRAEHADLSPDESSNPFFAPTFAQAVGGVYQARPYVSPDTHEWVVSNSTPLVAASGHKVALVHFEITVESFRRAAALLAGDHGLRVVDRRSGRVVLDKDMPQRIHQPLGVPTDHRFAGIARETRGLTDIAGRHAAYETIRQAPGNQNDWVVVASAPRPEASLSHSLGGPPLALILLGLALAGGALAMGRRPTPRPAPAPA